MKVLFLTKYDRLGASSRYRSLQYFPVLERAGIECTSAPLFNDKYLQRCYALGRGALTDYLMAFGRRVMSLLHVRQYDLVVIEYELFPFIPAFFERFLKRFNIRYLVDYDDAVFHRYDLHRNSLVRRLLGDKIGEVMRNAQGVVVGNAYLDAYARQAGATMTSLLPTVVDLQKYAVKRDIPRGSTITIGWIGSPSTTPYLLDVIRMIAAFEPNDRMKIAAMGAAPFELPGLEIEFRQWDEAKEVQFLLSCDIGIMPLPDTPWARGKCGFKLIQYMACGLPVVASPVGVNCEIVDHGKNGFLASTPDEWWYSLNILGKDPELRERLGAAGRQLVEDRYSLQAVAGRYIDIIREAALQ